MIAAWDGAADEALASEAFNYYKAAFRATCGEEAPPASCSWWR